MRSIYLEIIYQHGSITASFICLFLTLSLIFLEARKVRIQTASVILIILATAISAEFYPFQLSWIPINYIYPLTLILLIIQRFGSMKLVWLTYFLFIVHSLMLLLALNSLSVRANTWGDGAATAGVFQVPNSIIILFYLGLRLDSINFIILNKIIIGILAIITICITTNGFQTANTKFEDLYYSNDVIQRRHYSIACSLILIVEGILYLMKRKTFANNGEHEEPP